MKVSHALYQNAEELLHTTDLDRHSTAGSILYPIPTWQVRIHEAYHRESVISEAANYGLHVYSSSKRQIFEGFRFASVT